MKTLILTLAGIFALNAHATWGQPHEIDGQWVVMNRVCVDEETAARTQDRFVLGRDSLELDIKGDQGTVTTKIEGETYSQDIKLNQEQQRFFNANTGKSEAFYIVEYEVKTLRVVTSDFGPGGTCYGRQLWTIFKRK